MAIPPGLLADPAELSELLGVPADDVKLLAGLRAASRRFSGATDYSFTPVAADERWCNGDGSVTLLLPGLPVRAVTEVEVDGELLTLTDPGELQWSAEGVLRRPCAWPDRLRSVRVVYDHGFTSVPEDVQEAVIDQARSMYTIKPGVQSISVDGQSVTFGAQAATGTTQQWADAVARYTLQGDRA